jgi:restriction system protein
VRLYHHWKIEQPSDSGDEETEEETPGKVASITLEQAEEQAWSEIDQYLRTINPYEFQELVASLLRAMGYHVSWIAPAGKDGGIDTLAASDPLGTQPPRINVQVQRKACHSKQRELLANTSCSCKFLVCQKYCFASLIVVPYEIL